MSTDSLIYYPRVRAILRAHKTEPPPRDEARLLAQVQQAVAQLEASGARMSRAAVACLLEMSACNFKSYPRLKAFLTERVNRYQQDRTRQHQEHEAELMVQIQAVIEGLTARDHRVTQQAIGDRVGQLVGHLQQYPRVKSLLHQVTQPGRLARSLSSTRGNFFRS